MRCEIRTVRQIIQESLGESGRFPDLSNFKLGSEEWRQAVKERQDYVTDAHLDQLTQRLQQMGISQGTRVFWKGFLDPEEEPFEPECRIGTVTSATIHAYSISRADFYLKVQVTPLFANRELEQLWNLDTIEVISSDLDWRPDESLPEDFYAL